MSEIQTVQKTPLVCVESLNASTPINRMFRQIETIVHKNEISVPWLINAIRRWKAGQKDFSLGLLLRIAILFRVDLSVLLSSNNLESQVQLHNLNLRAYVSDDYIWGLTLSIDRYLQSIVRASDFTLEELAKNGDFSLHLKGQIPLYMKLVRILKALNIDIIDFIKTLESSTDFNIHNLDNNSQVRWMSLWENQRLRWVRQRVTEAVGLSGLTRTEIKEIIRIKMFLLYELNLFFSSFFRLTRATNIKIAMFFDPEIHLSSDHIQPENVRKQRLSEAYMNKAHRALIYLIKFNMQRLGLSIQELAIKSGININTLRNILLVSTRKDLLFLNLVKIVEKGFETELKKFFLGFEEYVESFDHFQFDIQVSTSSHMSQTVQNALQHLENRALEIVHFTGIEISLISWLIRTRDQNSQKKPKMFRTISSLLRFMHIFGITFSQLYGNEDVRLLIDPNRLNLKKIPRSVVTSALTTLNGNIQRELSTSDMSLSELQIRLGVSRVAEISMIFDERLTVRRAFEVAEALDKELSELFEGVSTF